MDASARTKDASARKALPAFTAATGVSSIPTGTSSAPFCLPEFWREARAPLESNYDRRLQTVFNKSRTRSLLSPRLIVRSTRTIHHVFPSVLFSGTCSLSFRWVIIISHMHQTRRRARYLRIAGNFLLQIDPAIRNKVRN